jgi:hypothetical protein
MPQTQRTPLPVPTTQILLKNNPAVDLVELIDTGTQLPRHLGGTCDHVAALAGPDGSTFSWARMAEVQAQLAQGMALRAGR